MKNPCLIPKCDMTGATARGVCIPHYKLLASGVKRGLYTWKKIIDSDLAKRGTKDRALFYEETLDEALVLNDISLGQDEEKGDPFAVRKMGRKGFSPEKIQEIVDDSDTIGITAAAARHEISTVTVYKYRKQLRPKNHVYDLKCSNKECRSAFVTTLPPEIAKCPNCGKLVAPMLISNL